MAVSFIGGLEETGEPRESHRPGASHWQTLSHNDVSSTSRNEGDSNSQIKWIKIKAIFNFILNITYFYPVLPIWPFWYMYIININAKQVMAAM
jgi:hypothetical protein